MVIIFCREYENSIIEIVDWLNFFKVKHKVFTNESKININLRLNNKEEKVYLNDINIDNIVAVYYRNGEILANIDYNKEDLSLGFIKKLDGFLDQEWSILRDFLFINFSRKKIIGNYNIRFPNKLYYLSIAKKCGLKIPPTIVGTKRKYFDSIKTVDKITKPLNEIFNHSINNYNYSSYTKRIENKIIQKRKERFFPSLAQEEIIKKYELRIFFLKTKLYPMAIFSGNTAVDVRQGNLEKEKRLVPYNLDNIISKKILKFIKTSKLNTGSMDLIVSEKNEFYFLEVNPCGQYGYLNKYCNYSIEKDIVKALIK